MGGKTFDKDAIENLGYGFKRDIDTRIGGKKYGYGYAEYSRLRDVMKESQSLSGISKLK